MKVESVSKAGLALLLLTATALVQSTPLDLQNNAELPYEDTPLAPFKEEVVAAVGSVDEAVAPAQEAVVPAEAVKPAEEAVKPVEESVKSAEEDVKPAAESVKPAFETAVPLKDTVAVESVKPAIDAVKPAFETAVPFKDSAVPVEESDKPAAEAVKSAEESVKPAVEDDKPALEAVKPSFETAVPVKDAAVPADKPAAEAVKPAEESVKPAVEDVKPETEAIKPAFETAVPFKEAVVSAQESDKPTVEAVKPTNEALKLVVESLNPVVQLLKPAAEAVKPVDEKKDTASEAVKPAFETAVPFKDAAVPVEDAVKPAAESAKPTPEAVKPEVEALKPVVESLKPAAEAVKPAFETAVPLKETAVPAVVEAVDPEQLKRADHCEPEACQLPNCRCSDQVLPTEEFAGHEKEIPQFITVTFDDAVNTINYPKYQEMFANLVNPDHCIARGTFFISHEYTDYSKVNALYNEGHEIALHSVTHGQGTEYWRNADVDLLVREFGQQLEILEHFAKVDPKHVHGLRLPFLQLSGNNSFVAAQKLGLQYDSSWPTQQYNDPPMWPYTLDYLSVQDCQIKPCPTASIPGFWVQPMVTWQDMKGYTCSMIDACVYPPEDNVDAIYNWILENFNRHYEQNRAPFGMYLHSAWFGRGQNNFAAMRKFLEHVNQLPDVYITTPARVLQWMKHPSLGKPFKGCVKKPKTTCRPVTCPLPKENGETHYMTVCDRCPAEYPWLDNPLGKRIKKHK